MSDYDVIQTLAGQDGVEGSTDGLGAQASMRRPSGLCVDPTGYCYVSDTGNASIRRISHGGMVETVELQPTCAADKGAIFQQPRGIAATESCLYVADSKMHRIISISTVCGVAAGLGRVLTGQGCRGYKDGTDALFNGPRGLALAPDGRLFICDSGNYRLRCLHTHECTNHAPAPVSTVAGDGAHRSRDGTLLHASFAFPYGLCWDVAGASNGLYVSEWEGHRVRRVDLGADMVYTVAGCGVAGFRDGPALAAEFDEPCMLASDTAGNVFVADSKNNAIR
eukprot:CAMPEP_0179421568 /NCGR_PEP_ID=MMETSP0799-20121207/9860_1 /TAXON_ID=46947 /ORGANISM="Geminigera cryophila, Strain CCMP2564" /LENGTH=279 /DNA_ID=CAMNT_0021195433 /DNA_START=95 /DNA_END=930 /DNA_ORIENTATION=+